jgi:hypothetical protein
MGACWGFSFEGWPFVIVAPCRNGTTLLNKQVNRCCFFFFFFLLNETNSYGVKDENRTVIVHMCVIGGGSTCGEFAIVNNAIE